MSTLNPRRFTRPEVLRSIEGVYLRELLLPFNDYLQGRNLTLPDKFVINYDFEALSDLLMSPDTDTPEGLSESLFFIADMATEEGMDILLEEAKQHNLEITDDQDLAPADVAVQVWLQKPEILMRKHTEQNLHKLRKFEYYQTGRDSIPEIPEIIGPAVSALTADLNCWYAENRRGDRTVQISYYRKDGEIWFLVRHGGPFQRVDCIEKAKSVSLFYRPGEYDVVVYNQKLGEIRMNPNTTKERELFRSKFGEHLFGDKECFPGSDKYTLEPLRTLGRQSLVCSDIEGLEAIKLREIQYFWGGTFSEYEIRKSDDLFAGLAERGKAIPDKVEIRRAKFEVKFTGSKKPRTVVICPTNIAKYTYDEDGAIVEQWLTRRGFIKLAEDGARDGTEEYLAAS